MCARLRALGLISPCPRALLAPRCTAQPLRGLTAGVLRARWSRGAQLGPYGIAEAATEEVLAKAEEQRAVREAEMAAKLEGARQQAATIDAVCGSTPITIMQRAGPDGKLFGSVTAAEISELVEDRTGVAVDKKNIDVPSIGEAGSYVVGLKLHPKVDATINIVIIGQE